jgi:uroporphyrinogen-III decarboxylase
MNGRERVLAAINGQPHDRVPVAQHNFPFAARHVGITMEQFRRRPDKAARALADTAHVFGNFDPSSVLAQGTPELVRERSLKAIEIARRSGGRFVLCPGCTVGANTPPENIRAMSDAARQPY